MKEIIFYYPRKKPVKEKSGGTIRPFRMISAFEESGFKVHQVMGDVPERKRIICDLKTRISAGEIIPAFVYMETTNLPLPMSTAGQKRPSFCMDLMFLFWLKRRGVKIGLFYRDLFWKFKTWWERQGFVKGCVKWPLYYYELFFYARLADVIFCPSAEIGNIIQKHRRSVRCVPLPPGCIIDSDVPPAKFESTLDILYVGGCRPPKYDLSKFFLACGKLKQKVNLTVCTRKDEWEQNEGFYRMFKEDNISIVHETGAALRERYRASHVSILPICDDEYWGVAMPLKLFESIGYLRPVIAGANCTAGRFVESNGIGWVTDESVEGLINTIDKVLDNPDLLADSIMAMKEMQSRHTWRARALAVEQYMEKMDASI
jgi:glycosyltransferase involved in cell wall biosynthesis